MISVLTSVYNENQKEIRESFDSILSQSFSDFEVIVVVDKPDNEEAIALLNEYKAKDDRVKIIINEKNIGLAMSMNVAAEAASGEYFLRVDADDVCYADRFEKQYKTISESNCDLVCGNYDFIDENGNLLPQKAVVYTDKQINALLPYRNVIHHPTVIMKAEKFDEVGGYRNYKCAQDYDLWLRMLCSGYKMHMMPEKLIKYRVRQNSTTGVQRFRQVTTLNYIRSLYKQNNVLAGYSYEKYIEYLDKMGVNSEGANEDFLKNSKLYTDSKRAIAKGKLKEGVSGLCNVFFKSKYYRPNLWRSIKISIIRKVVK